MLTFVQVWIFIQWPPPDTVPGFYALFAGNPLLGLLSLDLIYLVNNIIVLLLYLALFGVLQRRYPSAASIALLLGSVGVAAYMASNVSFEMWSLADAYQAADPGGKGALLAAGEVLVAGFQGTAFNVYYVLSAIALFLFARSMLTSPDFGRATGAWGMAAAVLMVVPSTAGTVGMVFALASLVPWVVFCLLAWRELLGLAAESRRGVSG